MQTIDTDTMGLATNWFRPSLMQRPHRHNEVEINFLEAGSMTYLFGGTRIRIIAGQLALFWATIPHQVVQIEDAAILHWLTIPFATFLRWQLPDLLTQRIIRGNFVSGTAPVQSYQQQFRQWYNDLQQTGPELRKIVALEVEACLRRLSLSTSTIIAAPIAPASIASQHAISASARVHPPILVSSPAGIPVLPDEPEKTEQADRHGQHERKDQNDQPEENAASIGELGPTERIASFIAEHYTEPLPIAKIAREVNLHPNYAMSIFRKNYGISIVDYITQYRIAHAQRLLITTDLNVSQIAIEAGFGSVSRFYTAFKAACQRSPGEYRAAVSPP